MGEGDSGEMHDFAWIEDVKSGRAAWEMTYRGTTHAGGARKNHVFDDVITLRPGEYVVHYESDGSHSFGDWNAAPPDDPHYWGVTLRRAQRK